MIDSFNNTLSDTRYRHNPWEAGEELLQTERMKLGEDYPLSMLDLKVSRERALERFKALA